MGPTIQERLTAIEGKVGLNKDGVLTGNGLINALAQNKEDIEDLTGKIENIRIMQTQLDMRFDILENNIKDLQESVSAIEHNLKDNVTMKTFSLWKNVIIGVAGVCGAFVTIGYFLSKLLSLFYEKGQ